MSNDEYEWVTMSTNNNIIKPFTNIHGAWIEENGYFTNKNVIFYAKSSNLSLSNHID